eukprot:TRINITY_DN36713_c1_g3_i1.p1 TRINITY_DN36713_c1_g3~~TRINITY_DN36713_c1_g3_i1.p1  ORF type:complete len:703 (+),score=73.17 TRINITY_DN36713_c1_g3_i1:27-2111(+)
MSSDKLGSASSAYPSDDADAPTLAERKAPGDFRIALLASAWGSRSNISPSYSSLRSLSLKLTSNLPPGLLRGVALETAMEGFGKHWASISCKASDHELSRPVDELHDFISHDWQNSRWGKYAAMCFVYNDVPTLIAGFLVGLLVCVLQCTVQRPEMATADMPHWCLLCGLVVHNVIFCSWQQLQATFTRWPTRRVFLDKLCINQINEADKQAGIRGLAGFLGKSERVVILWSPRYFTRLWCTYELATWCHLERGSKDSVYLMPTAQATVSVWQHVTMVLAMAFSASIGFHIPSFLDSTNHIWFYACSFCGIAFLSACYLRFTSRFVQEWSAIGQQLLNFSVRDASCYCCSCGHIHPETGQKMSCDRQLVYSALQEWFDHAVAHLPTGRKNSLDYLDHFDHQVRTLLGTTLSRCGVARVYYRHALCVSMPIFFLGVDIVVHRYHRDGPTLAAQKALEIAGLLFCAAPTVVQLFNTTLPVWSERVFPPDRCRYGRWVKHTIAGLIAACLIVTLWLPLNYATNVGLWEVQIAWFAVCIPITSCLYSLQLLAYWRRLRKLRPPAWPTRFSLSSLAPPDEAAAMQKTGSDASHHSRNSQGSYGMVVTGKSSYSLEECTSPTTSPENSRPQTLRTDDRSLVACSSPQSGPTDHERSLAACMTPKSALADPEFSLAACITSTSTCCAPPDEEEGGVHLYAL